MKTLFLLLLMMGGYAAHAQIIVYSQNKCYGDKVDEIQKMVEEDFAPFLNAQVDAGNLTNWGVLTHGWGDAWNLNIYYGAQNFAEFQSAWNEAVKQFSEKFPEGFKKFQAGCFEHKDSFYNAAYAYPPGNE